jgi:hypothetical protein
MSDLPASGVCETIPTAPKAQAEDGPRIGNGGALTASHGVILGAAPPTSPPRAVSRMTSHGSFLGTATTSATTDVSSAIENLLQKDDVVIAISASGNSPSVARAFEYARFTASTIGLVGFRWSASKEPSDVADPRPN